MITLMSGLEFIAEDRLFVISYELFVVCFLGRTSSSTPVREHWCPRSEAKGSISKLVINGLTHSFVDIFYKHRLLTF